MRLLALLLLAVTATPAAAASLALTQPEKEAALREGRSSVTVEEAFDREWRVKNRSGESVLVITPFYRLALAARNAAFKNEPMKPDEPEKILKAHGDRVLFSTSLVGDRPDFARYYTPLLLLGEREIKPAFVQNERTAMPRVEGGYLARCEYGFPVQDLQGNGEVVLVVKNAEGRDVSRFAVNLASMR